MTVRGLPRRSLLALALALAGCGESEPAVVSFPALRYNYLPVLRLNVSAIAIEDDYVPSPDAATLDSLAPDPPAAALRQMAEDRLGAYGTSGKAVFVIEDASLVRMGSELDGSFAVRLDVYSIDGTRAGFAEARVARTAPFPSGSGLRLERPSLKLRQTLYDFTRQMMDSMNVEFEYQIRRTLGDWLIRGGQGAPPPVQSQPLPAPGTGTGAAPAASLPAAAPSASAAGSSSREPQPGILGTLPLGPAPATTNP